MNARYQDPVRGQFISEDPVFLNLNNTEVTGVPNYADTGLTLLTGGRPSSQTLYLANPQAMNSYTYSLDNPVSYRDPTGKAIGLDDAAALLAGGASNVTMQAVAARATGQSLTWGQIAGAFVSGGTLGVGVVDIPETGGLSLLAATRVVAGPAFVNGTVAGAAGNFAKQAIDLSNGQQKQFDLRDLTLDTGGTGVINIGLEGLLPTARIAGLTIGRGNPFYVAAAIDRANSRLNVRNRRREMRSPHSPLMS